MHEPLPTQRKPRIVGIAAGLVALLLVWFVIQLFGPNPRLIISPQTTYIISPLGPDGLPDYEGYLLQRGSEGVTPENNAAVLTWQALWPGELRQQDWLSLCDALGMKKVPSGKGSLLSPYDQTVRDALVRDFAKKFGLDPQPEDEEYESYGGWQSESSRALADEMIDQAMVRPWTSEQLPALAQWVNENEQPLELLVAASRRPKYFSPSPSFLNGVDESLFATLLPGIQGMRRTARGLCLRASWHIGEGRLEESWRDLHACHRLARLTAQNNFLVSQLVALAIEGMALRVDAAVLGSSDLEPKLARQILADLAALGPVTDMAKCIDEGERSGYLDFAVRLAEGKLDADALDVYGVDEVLRLVAITKVDWNVVLSEGNDWYDQLVAAFQLPTRAQRQNALDTIENRIAQQSSFVTDGRSLLGGVFSGGRRSRLVSAAVASMLLPAVSACSNADDRTEAQRELARVTAALAVYRAEQGEYPEQLSDLVPVVLPNLPIDLYTGKPLLYERKDDGGYLLYSVFENGTDDGGTDINGEIVAGEWLDHSSEVVNQSDCDLVIRVPVPKFKLPSPPAEEDLEFEDGDDYGEY